ncbi:hypothetical protein [Sphingomonas sp. Leaf242]|uniref:hypothetical protein n=1 Tax=Sphingomonas sp. Leaf242 TaxID=1736304 RepID=UPI0012E1DC33|nr:hypothetical protein [Sphingomonas sp. Leaf242]
MVAFVPDVHSTLGDTVTYISVAFIIGVCFAFFYWAWGAPMRALARRPIIGQPLTRIEARQLALSKISYGQLALAAFGGVWIGWTQAEKYDALNGSGVAWLGFGALLVTLAGVQAGCKWIVERKA